MTSALEMAATIARGGSSATAEVEAAIERAERMNPLLDAIVADTFEQARERAAGFDAAQPDRSAAHQPGPLSGVPMLLKDLFTPVEGDPSPQGNAVLAELDARYDHTGAVGRRFRGAGMISIGRSHSPEFGCGQCPATAETTAFGYAHNPWDLARTPLGSSGGSAAAVAAGIVPIAHATDGGGSTRIPASACGLVGLKPQRGRISSAPAGELWAGGVADGVLTRTVADTAAALDVLAGPEPGDPYLAAPFEGSYLDQIGRSPGELRVGVVTALPYAETDPECVQATEAAAAVLVDLGHRVSAGHPEPMDRLDYMYDYIRVIRVSLTAELAMFEPTLGRAWTEDDVEPGTWINHQRGCRVSAPDYVQSRDRLHTFTREMVSWWSGGWDLLVSPTLAVLPPANGYLVEADERENTRRLATVTPFLPQFNVTGQPAVSLPLGESASGLPIGVQLVAAPGREDVLLRVAAQLEQAMPWSHRRPGTHA